jgi:hypothetical protein
MQVLYTPQNERPSRNAGRGFIFGAGSVNLVPGLNTVDDAVSDEFLDLDTVKILLDCNALTVVEEKQTEKTPHKNPPKSATKPTEIA